jgi:hypothetical protein
MYRKFDVTENLFFCIVLFLVELNTAYKSIRIEKNLQGSYLVYSNLSSKHETAAETAGCG